MDNVRRIVKWQHLVMVLLVATLQACTERPSAEISSSKTQAETNESINFINTSTEAESYLWEFGDGTSSEEASPTKAFAKPGIYTVKFTAFSKGKNKTDEAMLFITVSETKKLNTYFIGTYQFDVTWNDGCMTGHNTYNMEVLEGEGNDQVILKNFMDKQLENIKAKVVQTTTGYKLVVLGNQTATDNSGVTWRIAAEGDYVIDKIDGNSCAYANGTISKVNSTGNCDVTYSEQGADCP